MPKMRKKIKGVKIAHGAPEITHLFFADDSLMFCRANKEEITHLTNIITTYQAASGQLVNVNKSEILFSKHVKNETRHSIHQILPMQRVEHFSKYLGLPTYIGRAKTQVFQHVQDKIWKKLKGWKEKNLSFAGRATLIKAVAQAIPTYVMSNFLLPKGLCDQMESQICNFWWGSNVDRKKIHWVNWKKTCKAKSKGGVGFKDMRAFNEALLAKQGWRLITNPESLVAKLLKAKYYPSNDFLNAKQIHNSSFSWQSIQKASWLLKKGCRWIIGDGKSISIWKDRWIHSHFGCSTWSKQPNDTPFHKVSDLIDRQNMGWNAQLIHQLFYTAKANLICAIPITNIDQEDIISWQGTKDGNYSVKSGYQAIIDWQNSSQNQPSSSHHEDNPRWKKFWKLDVPPKQLHLIWRILNNAIPVKDKLLKRGIRCAPLCAYCNDKLETIYHIFIECEWVRKVWFASPLTINLENSKTKHIQDWMDYMASEARDAELQIISTTLYSIWRARNEREFEGKFIPPIAVMQRAMKILHEFKSNQHTRACSDPTDAEKTRNNTRWSLPPKGTLKLNVDAHSLSDGRWGLGILLRRDDGSTVGAVTRVRTGSDDALLAESMDLQEALTLIQKWNLPKTIIEMDAKTVVDAVNWRTQPRSDWGNIVKACVKKMKERNNVNVSWIRRIGNTAAHELAKWARYEPNKEWLCNFPTCITEHIQNDMGPVSLI